MNIILLLLLASPSWAGNYKFHKRVDPAAVAAKIRAAGISADKVSCDGNDECAVYNASADPSSVIASYVYIPPVPVAADNRAAAIILVKKLRASTATQAEKDELLGRLAFMLLAE